MDLQEEAILYLGHADDHVVATVGDERLIESLVLHDFLDSTLRARLYRCFIGDVDPVRLRHAGFQFPNLKRLYLRRHFCQETAFELRHGVKDFPFHARIELFRISYRRRIEIEILCYFLRAAVGRLFLRHHTLIQHTGEGGMQIDAKHIII